MKTYRLAILLLLLLPPPVWAQPGPIYFVEHDWTFRLGRVRFGLYQDRLLGDEKYGGGRHTTLYFGPGCLRTRTRLFQKTTLAVLPFGAITLCALYLLLRKRPNI